MCNKYSVCKLPDLSQMGATSDPTYELRNLYLCSVNAA
jgi:hypothetical protein